MAASLRAHQRQQPEYAPGPLPEFLHPDQWREQRPALLEAEEQCLRRALQRPPAQRARLVQHRVDHVQLQQPRVPVRHQIGEPLGIEAQMIGPVEAGAGEAGSAAITDGQEIFRSG